MNKEILIICRGGGDLATGIVHRLFRAGYQVLILETAEPAAIRRQVSFCEAVYEGTATVEGVTAERIYTAKKQAVEEVLQRGRIPLLVDPDGRSIEVLKPDVVVDAIIAKKNLGTYKEMAPLVIGSDRDLWLEKMCIWWWNPCVDIIWHGFWRLDLRLQILEFPVILEATQKRGSFMQRQKDI